jgi:hypothetical protein
MSKRLEDFMKASKEEFDDLEPSADLWSRIEKHLPAEGTVPKKREAKMFSLAFVLKVAASIIIVMGIGFFVYVRNEKKQAVDYASINPAYAKQRAQYVSLVKEKRAELKTLTHDDPEMYKEFSNDIAKMDSTYRKLNSDLANSPNREYVLRAMIRTLQIQIEVLNQQLGVIERVNQMKEEGKDENKSI